MANEDDEDEYECAITTMALASVFALVLLYLMHLINQTNNNNNKMTFVRQKAVIMAWNGLNWKRCTHLWNTQASAVCVCALGQQVSDLTWLTRSINNDHTRCTHTHTHTHAQSGSKHPRILQKKKHHWIELSWVDYKRKQAHIKSWRKNK